jgi:hypothetical protein
MEPYRDLRDPLGRALFAGDLDAVKREIAHRTDALLTETSTLSHDEAQAEAARRVGVLQWGPTKVPIYNVLLLSTIIQPHNRASYLAIARWLSAPRPEGAGVPVSGKDLSGTPTLAHSISTKPSFDPEYAQILYDAGGELNIRNRYGAMAAHEIMMVWDPSPAKVKQACDALKWFLEHGGNMYVEDGDGQSPAKMCENVITARPSTAPQKLAKVWKDERERRQRERGSCCEFCGRKDQKLMTCSRCKKAKYCASGGRTSHNLDPDPPLARTHVEFSESVGLPLEHSRTD